MIHGRIETSIFNNLFKNNNTTTLLLVVLT
jgi:hypothetical protein